MLDDVIARLAILQRRVMLKEKELRDDKENDHSYALQKLEAQYLKLSDARLNMLELKALNLDTELT